MNELQFIKNYRDDDQLRKGFFELANSIFGLNFESWHEKGFWGNRYIPFSYVDRNKVVANVSVNMIDFIIQGKSYRALQIGTVMTHPDYRKTGLSASLMTKVLEEYEGKYDFMYLFANQSVLNFYPKFGFKIVDEYQFSMKFSSILKQRNELRKLDTTNSDDIHFIDQFAKNRSPVSQRFGTKNAHSIFMYHCLNVFYNDLYFLESEDAIVIFNKGVNQIDILDIISKRPVDINNILMKISGEGTYKIVFHYTPDYKGIIFDCNLINGSGTLFVKTNGQFCFPEHVKHPVTSVA
ncbi:GNAT family N-acetyltransferase [Bacillus sp. 03113]|uniref:GNAT family N-acetyltransferase n=1 Tax=Bacillus sp. 03113 TaxID=2578211 RepID=UPI0011423509|nr:GNAT family N-acetyltransferase [Bacillus sp. 03113]